MKDKIFKTSNLFFSNGKEKKICETHLGNGSETYNILLWAFILSWASTESANMNVHLLLLHISCWCINKFYQGLNSNMCSKTACQSQSHFLDGSEAYTCDTFTKTLWIILKMSLLPATRKWLHSIIKQFAFNLRTSIRIKKIFIPIQIFIHLTYINPMIGC